MPISKISILTDMITLGITYGFKHLMDGVREIENLLAKLKIGEANLRFPSDL